MPMPTRPKGSTIPPLWYVTAGLVGFLLLWVLLTPAQPHSSISYSDFESYLRDGRIAEATVTSRYIEGRLKTPLPDGRSLFSVVRVAPDIASELSKHGVAFSGAEESSLLRDLLSWAFPVLLFFGLWLLLFRGTLGQGGLGGGILSVGKSNARLYAETDTKVTFADVAGVDEAKEELREIVDFLKDPKEHSRLGARIPRGVLLVGPPGTGKTLLARAVAGEAGVPFFSISGSEFVEMFVGVGAARVRDLFERARKDAPAIIFIDELDALGRARGAFPLTGSHDEKEQTLNQLLAELDGFDPSVGLVLLAATNRPEILDPALLRAGRFDRQVLVDRPDRVGRMQIAQIYLKKIKVDPGISKEGVAAITTGFTGADIANLVNEAALVATRRNAAVVTIADMTAALERIVAGLEKKNRVLSPHERETVAYHEMGHALVALSLPGSDEIHKVSIIPRGIGALGYTIQRPTEDRYLMSREELENKMAVLLGGRAAESIVFGSLSTGAADDLVKVTDIARSIVTQYGMDEKLGNVAYERPRTAFLGGPAADAWSQRSYSEITAHEIDGAIRRLVDRAYAAAKCILQRRRGALDKGAKALLAKETLSDAELAEIAGSRPLQLVGVADPAPEHVHPAALKLRVGP